jgi:hypothetical protein
VHGLEDIGKGAGDMRAAKVQRCWRYACDKGVKVLEICVTEM